MWTSIGFAIFLLAVCGGLLSWQCLSARGALRADTDAETRDYLLQQRRRRTYTSLLVGLVGLAVLGSLAVNKPAYAIAYWGCVTALVLWMGLLAVADILSTRLYYRRRLRREAAKHAALRAELERLRPREGNGNGRPRKPPPEGTEPPAI